MLISKHFLRAKYSNKLVALPIYSYTTVMRARPVVSTNLYSLHRRYAWSNVKAFFKGEKPRAQQQYAKYGKDSDNPYRADYEKEIKERTQRKLNWGIKNRWEQRDLDDVYKNEDIRSIQFRDFNKQLTETSTTNIKKFHSVDEVYYYIDNMFKEGISETILSKALDIFIRDADFFTEKDLENPTFKKLLREISRNLITFSDELSYLKVAQFMDMFCISDSLLWVNLELFTMKKEHMFSGKNLIKIMTHFARQQEGSKDFYHFIEYQFYSKRFDECDIDDFVALGHNYYTVHTGSVSFFVDFSNKLLEKMDESISTYSILRVMQSFAEIGPRFPDIFTQCEYYILKRYEQLMVEEMTCAAACFAISGHGSNIIFNLFEKELCKDPNVDVKTLKDICRAFIFSLRGSNRIFKTFGPRIQVCLDQFTTNEKCFILSVYYQKQLLSKVFQETLEKSIAARLRETNEVTIEEIAMIVNVYTTTRACSREFQKLMEFTVLQRIDDLRANVKIYNFIGAKFERSGFCSIDTIKTLKEQLRHLEAEEAMMS